MRMSLEKAGETLKKAPFRPQRQGMAGKKISKVFASTNSEFEVEEV